MWWKMHLNKISMIKLDKSNCLDNCWIMFIKECDTLKVQNFAGNKFCKFCKFQVEHKIKYIPDFLTFSRTM